MTTPPHTLPAHATYDYLAEGAANVVYRIKIPDASPTAANALKGTLLRLRKALATTQSAEQVYHDLLKHVAPLFPTEHLLQHILVPLPPGLIDTLNKDLIHTVRKGSHTELLADDSHGFLIQDMSSSTTEILVEFKPKWLLQSPSAPINATRCRTCALRSRRHALKQKVGSEDQVVRIDCPLKVLLPGSAVTDFASHLLSQSTDIPKNSALMPGLVQRLTHFLRTTPILPLLRRYQAELDSSNVLFRVDCSAAEREKLRLAWTLRDCSLFVLLPVTAEAQARSQRSKAGISNRLVSAKLGDLDMKSDLKLEKWRRMEKELVDEGWYTGQDVGCVLDC